VSPAEQSVWHAESGGFRVGGSELRSAEGDLGFASVRASR
jgi:hypothetical protein